MAGDQLWAPWRLDYILRNAEEDPRRESADEEADCFLCRVVEADPSEDAANHVLLRGKRAVVVLNRYPYNNGHLLVAPKEHLAEPGDLDDETLFETTKLVQRMLPVLRATLNADGFNVGLNLGRVAGAGLPGHMHWHVVPRWNGDTNFMPVVGGVDVIPQSLDALYAVLRSEIDRAG